MNDLDQELKGEFQDEQYRYAYAESFLNTKIAAQIKTLREQREMTQAQVAGKMGIKQPGYRRFEDVNHSVWKTDSLWQIARALGVRLNISFETFGTLPNEKMRLTKESLRRPEFKDDPWFAEQPAVEKAAAKAPVLNSLQALINGNPALPQVPYQFPDTRQSGENTLQNLIRVAIETANDQSAKVVFIDSSNQFDATARKQAQTETEYRYGQTSDSMVLEGEIKHA